MIRTVALFALLALVAGVSAARADDKKTEDKKNDKEEPEEVAPNPETQACIASYEAVQSLRRGGQLRAARNKALTCARTACPKELAQDCSRWLDELSLSIPTVVFDARDDNGEFVSDVKIHLDEELLVKKLSGRAVEVDPGAHRVRAEARGASPVEMQVVFQEGEKNRRVDIAFRAAVQEEEDRVPIATWVFTGAAGAGVVVGAVFLGLGLDRRSDLDACKPACPPEEVDVMMRDLVIADVAFAAAVVSAVAAVTIYFTRPSGKAAETRTGLELAPGWAAIRTSF